jgi:hypothetical protein
VEQAHAHPDGTATAKTGWLAGQLFGYRDRRQLGRAEAPTDTGTAPDGGTGPWDPDHVNLRHSVAGHRTGLLQHLHGRASAVSRVMEPECRPRGARSSISRRTIASGKHIPVTAGQAEALAPMRQHGYHAVLPPHGVPRYRVYDWAREDGHLLADDFDDWVSPRMDSNTSWSVSLSLPPSNWSNSVTGHGGSITSVPGI